jgi:hypothetical protein
MLTREDTARLRQSGALTARERDAQAANGSAPPRGSPKETMRSEGSWGYARAVAA